MFSNANLRERNEALDTFVYASAALHGLISMGLRLNDEAGNIKTMNERSGAPVVQSATQVVRSAWMG